MAKNLTTRVSALENRELKYGTDIHNINDKLIHIENDMDDLKNITENNTNANLKTSDTLTNINMTLSSWKGGFKVIVWIVGSLGGIYGIVGILAALKALGQV